MHFRFNERMSLVNLSSFVLNHNYINQTYDVNFLKYYRQHIMKPSCTYLNTLSAKASFYVLLSILVASIFLMSFPLILDVRKYNIERNILDSSLFREASLVGIAAAFPALIDSASDILTAPQKRPVRIFLLIALFLPNIIFLNIRFEDEIWIVLTFVRGTICVSICFMQLNVYGDDIFRSFFFICMALVTNLSMIISCWLSITHICMETTIILYYLSSLLSFLLLVYIVYIWFAQLSKTYFRDITMIQLHSSGFLIAMCVIEIGQLYLIVQYGQCITSNNINGYINSSTYICTTCTLAIWFLQGQVIRLETLHAFVRYIYIYIYLLLLFYSFISYF